MNRIPVTANPLDQIDFLLKILENPASSSDEELNKQIDTFCNPRLPRRDKPRTRAFFRNEVFKRISSGIGEPLSEQDATFLNRFWPLVEQFLKRYPDDRTFALWELRRARKSIRRRLGISE